MEDVNNHKPIIIFCMCTYVCVCTHVRCRNVFMWGVCVCSKPEVNGQESFSFGCHLSFWDKASHWTWSSLIWWDCLPVKPWDPPTLLPCPKPGFFMLVLRWIQVPRLAWQVKPHWVFEVGKLRKSCSQAGRWGWTGKQAAGSSEWCLPGLLSLNSIARRSWLWCLGVCFEGYWLLFPLASLESGRECFVLGNGALRFQDERIYH